MASNPAANLAGSVEAPPARSMAPAPFTRRAHNAAVYAGRSLGEAWRTFRAARTGDGMGLAAALLRIRAKHFLWKLSPRFEFHRETIFGRTFECFEYYDLVTSFEIIFLAREYAFSPLGSRPRIVDCGSNIGLSILFFKHEFPDSTILAFEPDPQTFSLLSRNVERNALAGIELKNLALSGIAGPRDLYCDSARPGSTAMSLLAQSGLDQPKRVPCAQLSDFIQEDVDLLKLDIEGAELEVLDDLMRTGKIQRVRNLVIEYHPALFPEREGYHWLCETLKSNGFEYQIRSGVHVRPSAAAPPLTLFASRRPGSQI